MGNSSPIEWTGATWTPIRARVKVDAADIATRKGYASLVQIAEKMAGHVGPHCEHVSDGCARCYSGTNNERCLPSNGTGLPFDRRSRDLVDMFVDEKILTQPLRWKTPRKIFVCSQTDLFGEFVTDEMIDRVFSAMALCPQHTFQVLTKRAERMREYCQGVDFERLRIWMNLAADGGDHRPGAYSLTSIAHRNKKGTEWQFKRTPSPPLPNTWLGVSVENQEYAGKRIPHLRNTPAAVRFLSIEPLLEDIGDLDLTGIHWVIVGGESGPGARPFDIAWARNIIAQCKAAGVACFVKQLGANPEETVSAPRDGHEWQRRVVLRDRKGGDWNEWPEDLRVREYPA